MRPASGLYKKGMSKNYGRYEGWLEKWGQATFCPGKKGTGNFLGQKVACPLFHCPFQKVACPHFSSQHHGNLRNYETATLPLVARNDILSVIARSEATWQSHTETTFC